MDIIKFISDYLTELSGVTDKVIINILMVYLAIAVLIVFFRIILAAGYQTQYIIFSIKSNKNESLEEEGNVKEINKKEKKSKLGLVNKVLNEAVDAVEKGVKNPNIENLVKKNIMKLKFLFWSYRSIENFVLSFEQAIVIIGILLAFSFSDKGIFAVTTISIFISFKVIAMFCDFQVCKEKLSVDIVSYVEKEIIQIISETDINASISKFSKEVYMGIMKQAEVMKESIDKLGSNLTGALALSISEMTKAVESSIDKSSNFAEGLDRPIKTWSETINNASMTQEKINLATESLGEVVTDFTETTKSLGTNFNEYMIKTKEHEEIVKNNVNVLVETIEELKELNKTNKLDYETVNKQLVYIDKNQNVLDKNIQNYEVTLSSISSKIGQSLGEIVELQMQNSYIRLNEILLDNVNLINMSNKETLNHLYKLFENMQEQTKNQTQTIVKVKEQMDMQFDIIREKI